MKIIHGLLTFAMLLALVTLVVAQTPQEGDLAQQVKFKKLEAEIQALKLEVMKLQQELTSIKAKVPSPNTDIKKIISRSMKLTGLKAGGGPYKSGDIVHFQYALKNTSGPELQLSGNQQFPIGTRQHWIERLGEDPKIQAIPVQITRKGNLYAAGGYLITATKSIPPAGALFFTSSINTRGYPAGRYKYYVEYKDSKGTSLQMESVEFELLEN